jgi:hypothetical protein
MRRARRIASARQTACVVAGGGVGQAAMNVFGGDQTLRTQLLEHALPPASPLPVGENPPVGTDLPHCGAVARAEHVRPGQRRGRLWPVRDAARRAVAGGLVRHRVGCRHRTPPRSLRTADSGGAACLAIVRSTVPADQPAFGHQIMGDCYDRGGRCGCGADYGSAATSPSGVPRRAAPAGRSSAAAAPNVH